MGLEMASFDLLPQSLPSFARGFTAALIATVSCYPLDTIRRHIQLQVRPGRAAAPTLPGSAPSALSHSTGARGGAWVLSSAGRGRRAASWQVFRPGRHTARDGDACLPAAAGRA